MATTRTRKHSCLLTRDDSADAYAERMRHAKRLQLMNLTRRFCLHVEQARGTWQLWLYEYEQGDHE